MREWYFQAMGQEVGPLSAAELKTRVENGQIQPDTMVRRGLEGKWLFAEKVKGLISPVAEAPAPASPPVTAKPKTSATMSVVTSTGSAKKSEPAHPPRSAPVITIALAEEDDTDGPATAPSTEFYDFVGFREAISPILHRAVRQYLVDHRLTMTQLNRRALASFIARPELASDLMISNVAALLQPVNEKSNADGSHPLSEREQSEQATFRLTLFNCSSHTVEVTHGEFIPDTVEVRHYTNTGSQSIPAIDHQGNIPVSLDGARHGQAIPFTINETIAPLSAQNVVIWFRGTKKPSLTTVRGQLKFGQGEELALSDTLTIIMHGDSL